jgi:hypothetical protein
VTAAQAENARLAKLMRCHHDESCTAIVLRQDDEIKRLRDAVSPKNLADSLARTGIIHADAIDLPEGYDGGDTLARIAELSSDILSNAASDLSRERSGRD